MVGMAKKAEKAERRKELETLKTPLKACSQGQVASLCQFLSTLDQANPNESQNVISGQNLVKF